MLSAQNSNLLCDFVDGWPHLNSSQTSDANDGRQAADVLEELLTIGVLVSEPRLGRDATPVSIVAPSTPLLDEYELLEVTIGSRDLLQFALATIRAMKAIGVRGQRHELRRLRSQLAYRTAQCVGNRLTDEEVTRMRQALAVYLRFRPLLWKTQHKKRFEQVVLLKFLESHGFRPAWVFGVAPEPFRSHSWLQCGNITIDEAPGVASGFVPIAIF